MAGVAGFEPTNAGVKVLCLTAWRHPSEMEWWRELDSNQRRHRQQIYSLPPLATWVSLHNIWSRRWDSNPQPTDYKSVALPIELRRPLFKDGDPSGIRTRVASVKGWCVNHFTMGPRIAMVGAEGFEPPASCSQGRRASQAALRPAANK